MYAESMNAHVIPIGIDSVRYETGDVVSSGSTVRVSDAVSVFVRGHQCVFRS